VGSSIVTSLGLSGFWIASILIGYGFFIATWYACLRAGGGGYGKGAG
jgi:hypothetical protein